MGYKYKNDDSFYDVESLENVFLNAQYYPKQDLLIISYLDDDGLLNDEPNISQQDKFKTITAKIKEVTKGYQTATICFENLANDRDPLAHTFTSPSGTVVGSPQAMALRFGLANQYNDINKVLNYNGVTYIPDVDNAPSDGSKEPDTDWRNYDQKILNNPDFYTVINQYYPVKTTDTGLYDPEKYGFHFGFNSTNYDLTILSVLFAKMSAASLNQIAPNLTEPQRQLLLKNMAEQKNDADRTMPTAHMMRIVNNDLFSPEYKKNMPNYVDLHDYYPGPEASNYLDREVAHLYRNAWLASDRYLDIGGFNEHMSKVSLKRLSGMLGIQILESENLDENSDTLENWEQFMELIAYNVNDVYNTKVIFETPVYQNGFQLRQELLKNNPKVIYQNKPNSQEPDIDPRKLKVRPRSKGFFAEQADHGMTYEESRQYDNAGKRPDNHTIDRKLGDSSSAQFIAAVIAPYLALKDQPVISFMFPDRQVLNRMQQEARQKNETLPINEPYDVLEATKKWAEDHMPDHGESFKEIYQFYAAFRGRNINETLGKPATKFSGAQNEQVYGQDLFPFLYQAQIAELAKKSGLGNVNPNMWAGSRFSIPNVDAGQVTRELVQDNKDTNIWYLQANQRGPHTDERHPNEINYNSTCLATFSIGGIHGAEIKVQTLKENLRAYEDALVDYEAELQDVKQKEQELQIVKDAVANSQYADNLTAAYDDKFEFDDPTTGQHFKVRDFIKHQSKAKVQETGRQWRTIKPKHSKPKKPTLTQVTKKGAVKIRDEYAYVSVDKANHEDFSSYYPLLLTLLAVFRDPITGHDNYADLYHERLKLKAAVGDLGKKLDSEYRSKLAEVKKDPAKYEIYLDLEAKFTNMNISQNMHKLLLNAASGAGDASFYSPIRKNNAIVSMRLIGQLFAWRIGQAETFNMTKQDFQNAKIQIAQEQNRNVAEISTAEATDRLVQAVTNHEGVYQYYKPGRVPSTNTDGLYVFNHNAERNNTILYETVEPMLVKIKPETIDRFVSKDANNRLEANGDLIDEAKGGMLTSWKGSSGLGQNVNHPPIIDNMLAHYLAFYQGKPYSKTVATNSFNPSDAPYDFEYMRTQLKTKISDAKTRDEKIDLLKLFQWIVVSGLDKHRYVYANTYYNQLDPHTGKFIVAKHQIGNNARAEYRIVSKTNRIYLIKRPDDPQAEILTFNIATKGKLTDASKNKRLKAGIEDIFLPDAEAHEAWDIIEANTGQPDLIEQFKDNSQETKLQKISDMPQPTSQHLYREDLDHWNEETKKAYFGKQKQTSAKSQQPALIENHDLNDLPDDRIAEILNNLDLDAYLHIINDKFINSWSNYSKAEKKKLSDDSANYS